MHAWRSLSPNFKGGFLESFRGHAPQLRAFAQLALMSGTALATLLLNLPPTAWGDNEHFYFSQALFSSEANAGVFASGFPNYAAQIFIVLSSFVFDRMSVDSAWVVLRIVGYLSLAVGLGLLGIGLRAGPLALALSITAFMQLGQDYFGGEWIVDGIEAKVFSYSLGFSAVALFLLSRRATAWALVVLSVLLHPLVGLSFLVFAGLLDFLASRAKGWTALRLPSVAVGLSLGYVAVLRMLTSPEDSSISDFARMIYTVVRHPHHLAPFGGLDPVSGAQIDGWLNYTDLILPTLMAALLALAIRREKSQRLRIFLLTLLWLHLWVPASLMLAWLDRGSQFLGPLYMLRPMSVLLLFSVLGLLTFLLRRLKGPRATEAFGSILIIWAVLGAPSPGQLIALPGAADITPTGQAVVAMVKSHVGPLETVLVDFENIEEETGLTEGNFELIVNRGQIAVWKFVPTRDQDIVTWWEVLEEKRAILAKQCTGVTTSRWDYILLALDSLPSDAKTSIVDHRAGLALVSLKGDALFKICRDSSGP